MTYYEELKTFYSKHPYSQTSSEGATYRYVLDGINNKKSLVFFNGGMNVSEMWMRYIDELAKDFKVLIFDYPQEIKSNAELIKNIHTFLTKINVDKPVLIGASDGGLIAQLYTKKYPDDVRGLVLLSTGGLDKYTLRKLKIKYFFAPAFIFYMRHCNYEKLKPKLIKSGVNFAKNESCENKAYTYDMFRTIFKNYTREKDIHITSLAADIIKQKPVTPADFYNLKDKIMLIFPTNDFFPKKMQLSLIDLMHNPEIKYIDGCHVSTILQSDKYISDIRNFVNNKC